MRRASGHVGQSWEMLPLRMLISMTFERVHGVILRGTEDWWQPECPGPTWWRCPRSLFAVGRLGQFSGQTAGALADGSTCYGFRKQQRKCSKMFEDVRRCSNFDLGQFYTGFRFVSMLVTLCLSGEATRADQTSWEGPVQCCAIQKFFPPRRGTQWEMLWVFQVLQFFSKKQQMW